MSSTGGARHKPFSGVLTPGQIASGINAALRNAQRLLSDARLLLGNRRFPSALALATLAIEEVGKEPILRELALARTDEEARAHWKRYRSHRQKNIAWVFPEFVASGARQLDDFSAIFSPESDHPQVLDSLKQVAFYSDNFNGAKWHVPEDLDLAKLAEHLVLTAEVLLAGKGSLCTAREIELWVEHLGPAWKNGTRAMKAALIRWQAAMNAEGLSEMDIEYFSKFIGIEETWKSDGG